jgi:hypothetical protein
MTRTRDHAEPSSAVSHAEPATAENRGFSGRLASQLTWLLVTFALAAALAGLAIDGIYTGAVSTAEMFRGYDVVTVAVVVPGLAFAASPARRGSIPAQLLAVSLIAYLVYTYAYYVFGTGFNDLFLLHAAVFASGVFALILTVAAIDLAAVKGRFGTRTQVPVIAGILGLLAVALGGMWIYLVVDNAVTGDVPAGSQLIETDTIVHLGIALDLTLLVPLYAVAAVLLWRRAGLGYLLATVALLAGLLHQVSYLVALPMQAAADVPGAVAYDPGEPVIVALYLIAAALLLHGLLGGRRVNERSRSSS